MICWDTGEAVKILLLKPGTLTSREMIQIYRIEQESRVWIPDRHWKMFVPCIIWFASLRLNLWCESLIIQSSSTFLKRSFCTSMTCFISIIITIDNQIYNKHAVLQPGCPSVAGRQGQKENLPFMSPVVLPSLAAVPGGPADHAHVLCWRRRGEAVCSHLSHWKCGGLAAGSGEIHEGQYTGQHRKISWCLSGGKSSIRDWWVSGVLVPGLP